MADEVYKLRDEQFGEDIDVLTGALECINDVEIMPDADDTIRMLEERDEAIGILRQLTKEMYEWLSKWECECFESRDGCGRCTMLRKIAAEVRKVKAIDDKWKD